MGGRRETDKDWVPRVVALESTMQMLTSNVNNLTQTVREQGENTEAQLHELTIAVTSATGPRKTDWSLIVSFVFLALALGAAVFAPLNMRLGDNHAALLDIGKTIADHKQLNLHPVGEARINYLEVAIKEKQVMSDNAIRDLDIKLQREFTLQNELVKQLVTELDIRLQREFLTAQEETEKRLNAVKAETSLAIGPASERVKSIEDFINSRRNEEFLEL